MTVSPRDETLEIFEDGVARLRIDADGRFVAQQELRPVQECRREVQPALHAAGKFFTWSCAGR